MLLFTAIFVFFKLTILQENYVEEISGRLDKTFYVNRIETQNNLFAILLILICGLIKRTQKNKGRLIVEVEVPAVH